MDLSFLRTRQKNTDIKFSNLDFNHSNGYTSQLGQILVTNLIKVLPNDTIKHRVNEETLLKTLENPSFTKFKHVHKSLYYPNTVLWDYWDNFFTNKPNDLWTNSEITSYINERQPYSIPKCYFRDLLPYMACAKGFASDFLLGAYLPQLPYIINVLQTASLNNINQNLYDSIIQYYPPYIPLLLTRTLGTQGLTYYQCCREDSLKRSYSLVFDTIGSNPNYQYPECGFYDSAGNFVATKKPTFRSDDNFTSVQQFLASVSYAIDASQGITTDMADKLKSYLDINNIRYFVRFKIHSEPRCKVNFTRLWSTVKPTATEPFDKTDFMNLICLDDDSRIIQTQSNNSDRYFTINNKYSDHDDNPYFILPLPSAVEATSFGFTPLAFFFYNCKNITKHLDHMGISIPDDFINFTEEDLTLPINLMPFFAYNRFYHEEVADKQRQVNCPNWSAANGLISHYRNTIEGSDPSLEKYQSIGWALHFKDIPYNKQYTDQDLKITTSNPFSAAMLLMGFDINLLCTRFTAGNETRITQYYRDYPFSQSFLEPVFQSYNGLLHLQYANFAPDYFNQSVMDPLAGSQDIQIPSTITQLQEKSKLQELLNQTAWTRNIKEFLQSQFDAFSRYTTIDDAVITGSCDVDVNISQVLQTSESAETPLGTRAGVGSAYGDGYLCDNQFHEFGYYMTVSYFVMDSTYINRLDKSVIAESSYLDLPFPQLANLGNEAIKMHEVKFGQARNYTANSLSPLVIAPFIHQYAAVYDGQDSTNITKPVGASPRNPHTNHTLDNQPLPDMIGSGQVIPSNINFGYIPRYSSYKFKFDELHGEFLTSLKNWVNSRELQIMPLQNYTFISYECQAQLSNLMKNFVDKDQLTSDSFLTNSYHVMSVRRCLPFVVNPSM